MLSRRNGSAASKKAKIRPYQEEDKVCLVSHAKNLGVDGWIILGWICRRWDVGIWTGLGWLRIETGGGRL